MKWLLLALSLVLISPLSAASWDHSASLQQSSDKAVVQGIDYFELTSFDTDTDNDDPSTQDGLLLAENHANAFFSLKISHCVSEPRPNKAIRAPPKS